MKDKFTLEYNEEQQEWHHNFNNMQNVAPNTHGWSTVLENCDNFIFLMMKGIMSNSMEKPYSIKDLKNVAKQAKNIVEQYIKSQK